MILFVNSSIYVMMKENKEIKRLNVDQQVQKNINELFSVASNNLLQLQSIVFDGKYKPEKDECLKIENYSLPSEITEAIDDPLKVESFEAGKEDVDGIKAIFLGLKNDNNTTSSYSIAFQRLRNDQYISTNKYRLFLDKNSFKEAHFTTLGISPQIDCLFINGRLLFTSTFQTKQLLDISQYYKEATDKDLEAFTNMVGFTFEDKGAFISGANQSIRKRVASILNSGVLDNCSPTTISKIAKQTGVDIIVKDDRIVFPNDKNDAKILLTFLDEGVFKGPFSESVFMTNSKRTIT